MEGGETEIVIAATPEITAVYFFAHFLDTLTLAIPSDDVGCAAERDMFMCMKYENTVAFNLLRIKPL